MKNTRITEIRERVAAYDAVREAQRTYRSVIVPGVSLRPISDVHARGMWRLTQMQVDANALEAVLLGETT